MYFHDPLPSDVRRKNYIPLFPDFRQNPLNSKSPSERKKKKKDPVRLSSAGLDEEQNHYQPFFFFFFYKSGPVQSPGFPLPPRLVGCPHLPSTKFQSMDLKRTVQIFFSFFFFSPLPFKTHPIRISPVRFGSGTSRGRALKRSLIHPTFFSSTPL